MACQQHCNQTLYYRRVGTKQVGQHQYVHVWPMRRGSCLTPVVFCSLFSRDDLIFLIYLYQRWIYRVDMTRVNEFGFSGKQQEERDAAAAAAGANGAAPVAALEVGAKL